MAAFTPRLDEIPEEFPIFPLPGALLLPHGKLPLNIFEPRYLALVEDALWLKRMFGMIQPDPLAAALATGPGLYRIGCLGRISAFSETDDGRFLITLCGMIRFAVIEELPLCRGYRRVWADCAAYAADLAPAEAELGIERAALLTALRGFFARRGIAANWEAIRQMPDAALVVTLAMACPFEVAEKQALLEAPSARHCAAALLALLEIGACGEGNGPAPAS